jgi:hypothetical protein
VDADGRQLKRHRWAKPKKMLRKGGIMKRKGWFIVIFLFSILVVLAISCADSTPVVRSSDTIPEENNESIGNEVQPTKEIIVPTNTLKPLGSARSNPAPLGSEVDIDQMTINIQGVIDPADEIITSGNIFNSDAGEGNKYILIDIVVRCNKSTDDKCNLSGFEFSVIDSNGIAHDVELFVAGVDGLFESGDFYGDSIKAGKLAFIVPIDDNGAIMKYEEIFGGEAYFSVY